MFRWFVCQMLALLFLSSCAQLPPGPQMKSPGLLRPEKKLELSRVHRAPWEPRVFDLREKGKATRQIAWPAKPEVVEEVLNSSNFVLSEGMMLDLADLIFGKWNSPCPAGNDYRAGRDSARIQTVGHDGEIYRIRVSTRKEGGWKVKISRHTYDTRYPGLVMMG